MMSNEFKSPSSEVLVKKKTKESTPKLFKVILLNDDYTPMEYVVSLLKVVFNKSESQAVNIMLMVHNKGSGICGIFTKDIAETKVFTVLKMAKHDQHPLKCIMEPE
jgi:ATP-dependent Clp protease adaptor protein ClpS